MKTFTIILKDPTDTEGLTLISEGIDLLDALSKLKEAGWQIEHATSAIKVK